MSFLSNKFNLIEGLRRCANFLEVHILKAIKCHFYFFLILFEFSLCRPELFLSESKEFMSETDNGLFILFSSLLKEHLPTTVVSLRAVFAVERCSFLSPPYLGCFQWVSVSSQEKMDRLMRRQLIKEGFIVTEQTVPVCFTLEPLFTFLISLSALCHPFLPFLTPCHNLTSPRRLWWAAPPWWWVWSCLNNTAPWWTPTRSVGPWLMPRRAATTLCMLGWPGGDRR